MSPVLTIRLFANFQLTYDGEPITHVKSAPMQSLLAYLLTHRDRPQARQHLAYLLWPDSTEAQARTNLRRELHNLRHALPEADRFLQVDTQFLQWRCDAPFALDIADFEAAVAQVEQSEAAGNEVDLRAAVEKAVALYAGDLLPSCYDDWIVSERERLSQDFARLLERLIQVLERQRGYALAIRYAQQLRRYDPLRETTYRHLMRLYALNGDRARALRVYHTCVTTLRRELGVDPSPATRESYVRLLDLDRPSAARPSAPVAALVTEDRLVGRLPEWKILQAAWHSAAPTGHPGQAHFLLVTGDAGIGKTRLVEELLEWVGRQGITTSQTRCYATGRELAYAPVADWLATETFRTALLGLDEVWLTEVARLLPTLMVERPDLPRPAPLTESGQRLRLFDALARVVLAGSQPLLLVIDDLHWCDRETLEWLHYLLRRNPHSQLLVAGTARTAEVGVDHPLHWLTLELRSAAQATEIELGPLSPESTVELAAQVAGRDVDSQQAAFLYAETEGNPLFVVEIVRGQWAPGLATASRRPSYPSPPAHSAGAARPLSSSPLPAKVQAVMQARLAQLSPQARQLAEIAATIGRSFTFQVLAQASDSDQELLVRGLDELWQRRVIREQGVDAYDFSHDKIREVAYAEISRARQQLLHRRVAQALESAHAGDLDAVSGQIAAHYERAGMFAPAALYYQRAAEMARRVYANQEAKVLYTQAVEASRRATPALDEAQLLPLYEGRARVFRSLTQLDNAIADFQTMRRMAQAAGNRQQEGESLCQLAYTHWLTLAEDQMPFVEQYAWEAMALFAQSGNPAIRARSLTMLGAVDQVHRKLADAGQKLEEALAISRHTQDGEALVQAISFLCLQTYLQGYFQATVQYAQEGMAVARDVQDGFNELRIAAFLCQGLWSAGNYAQALTLLHETMAQAEERGNRFVHGRLLNTLGWFYHELGDFVRAIAYNQQSAEQGRSSGIDHVEISALINLGYDYLALGQPARALAYFEPTLARVEREGFGAHKWRWQMKLLIGLAEHAASTGAYAQALSYVDAGLAEALATSSQKYMAKGWVLRGKILARLGRSEAAGAELQRAFALAEQLHNASLSYPVAYALGQWYEARGEARQAAALYALAKATVEQMATAIGDEALAALLLQSEPVRMMAESWARTL